MKNYIQNIDLISFNVQLSKPFAFAPNEFSVTLRQRFDSCCCNPVVIFLIRVYFFSGAISLGLNVNLKFKTKY